VDVRTGAEQTTNDFRFTWCQERGKESVGLRHVVPKTYKGAVFFFVLWFDADGVSWLCRSDALARRKESVGAWGRD